MARFLIMIALLLASTLVTAQAGGRLVNTPYGEQSIAFDFYFDTPDKMAPALYWMRALVDTLTSPPYSHPIDNLNIKVIVRGMELVTLAKKNYDRYQDTVERMRYYSSLGIEFKVCSLAAEQYGYRPEDFHEFVDIVPSALAELVHWQLKGYAVLTPTVMEKNHHIEDIR